MQDLGHFNEQQRRVEAIGAGGKMELYSITYITTLSETNRYL